MLNAIGKKLGYVSQEIFQYIEETKFSERFQRLLGFKFSMNKSLIGSLSCAKSTEFFSQEQKFLQAYFEFVLF
jgi:hypothetical protein